MRSTVVLLTALLAAGCGGGEGSPQKPASPAPSTRPTAPAPEDAPKPEPRWDVSQAVTAPRGARVRWAAVAGSFYPGDELSLRRDVEGRMARAPRAPAMEGKLRALVVPHAGYRYSGDTAAAAYALLEPGSFDRVVLLGPSHRFPLKGVSVSDAGYYRTPLGDVAVDTVFAAALREKADAGCSEPAHAREHSLEVQLPFLQLSVGPGVRIVPVLVGSDAGAQAKLARALAELLDGRTLVVVSTDLSHYPAQEVAEKADAATVESWKTLDPTKIAEVERRQLDAGHRELSCTMCGGYGVLALVRLARLAGIDSVKVLKTETSAAAGGDRQSVVGYAAAAFCASGKKPAPGPGTGAPEPDDLDAPPKISEAGRKKLLEIARAAATAAAAGKLASPPDLAALPEDILKPGGAFVTLTNGGKLRGCIGRFPGSDPIASVVHLMAAEAARDSRFVTDPVTAAEMPEIDVEISVLSPLRRISDWRKIRAGVHGVLLRRGYRRGVFLPQVATEQGWDRDEFLTHLARDKAGMAADAYKDPATEIFVFTALVFGAH